MTFLIVCGGSAGHINPAIAIAEELRNRLPDALILFVGADKILENRLVPAAGFDLINIKMSGLRRGISPADIVHNIITGKNLITANIKTGKILKETKPAAVIGTGGYICYPVLKKAAKKKIPTFLLEPNAYPGLAVRMLSSSVNKIFVTYPGTECNYDKPDCVVYTGTPVKRAFSGPDDSVKTPRKNKPLVISYWGSLGAPGMNKKIIDFMKINLKKKCFYHIHAAGVGKSFDDMITQINNSGITDITSPYADVREYITDMPAVMNEADIVISRAGASTIAELSLFGKPAVLIPSPNVTENHQEANAKKVQEAGGAVMVSENLCTGEELFDLVSSLINDKVRMDTMKTAQKSLMVKDASVKIADIILNSCF